MKHVLVPTLFIAAMLLAVRTGAAQALEAADNPMPSIQNIQPADTPTMLPANDAAPFPAAEYLDEQRHPPEGRSFKRGMLKRQYRWLPERDVTQASATPPEPTGLPPEANPPHDIQGAPLHGPDDNRADNRQRARPDLRDRERPFGLGRFMQEPPANPSSNN